MLYKKRILYLLSFLVFCFICCLPCNSNANTTGTVYLTTSQSIIEKSEEIEVSINLENNKTAAFHSYIYFDDSKLEYVSGPENSNVIGNRIIYVWYDKTGGKEAKEGELAKFKLKAKEDGLANFTVEGEFYSQIGQIIKTDFKETQAMIGKEETKLEKEAKGEQGTDNKKDNANLQVLRLDKEGLIPEFKKDIYDYYLTISNEIKDIEVLAIPENPNATFEITGNTNLKEGLNSIKVKVVSEDKTQSNTYTIQVTKTANLGLANTNLEILAIENILLEPPFDTNVTHYKIEVPNEITNLNILAIPENENANVQIVGKDNLKEGNNIIKVTVTAENGFTKKVYEINGYRRNQKEEEKYKEEQKENQNKLEEIYQTEKISTQIDGTEEKQTEQGENKKGNNILKIILITIIVILIILAIIKYRKNKKTHKI